MKSLNNLLTLLVLVIMIGSYSLVAQAGSPSDEPQTETTPESLVSESKTLLEEISKLSGNSTALKKQFKKAPEADYILFFSLLGSIEGSLRSKLDQLIEIKQSLDKENEDTDLLLQAIQPIIAEQSTVLQQEIKSLMGIITKMRNKEKQDFSLQYSIIRAEKEVDQLIAEWQKNIQRGKTFKLDVDEDSKKLNQFMQIRAIGLAGRIRLILDAIKVLDEHLKNASVEQQKEITQQLSDLQLRKTSRASNLESIVGLMKKQGLETTEFGKVLIVATGEILNENIDTKAVVSIFQMAVNNIMAWFNKNFALILFRIISFFLILLAFNILAGLLSRLVDRATTTSDAQSSKLLKNFFSAVTSNTVKLIGLIIALSQLGIEIGPLLAGMGVMGFIVGFALQDSISNFVSGMMILFYRPYDIEDFVEVAGISGKVKEMNLVSTTILTFDHQRMVIPNDKIWGDIIVNVAAESLRRIDLVFGIGYTENIAKAEKVLQEIIENHELILDEPEPVIKVHKLGESSVDFVVRPWVNSKDYWAVYWDVTRQVKEKFDAAGISIPFPQRDVHLYSADKNS